MNPRAFRINIPEDDLQDLTRRGGHHPRRAAVFPCELPMPPRSWVSGVFNVVNGNIAKAIACWFAITNNTPQSDVQLLCLGRHEDEFVKRDGRRLSKRCQVHVYNRSQPNRAAPTPVPVRRTPVRTSGHLRETVPAGQDNGARVPSPGAPTGEGQASLAPCANVR